MDNPLMALAFLLGPQTAPKPVPPNASLLLRYELWLRDHHKWLLPVLDAIRSATLFLPGRFAQDGGALTSEAIYTGMNLLSVFHDHLLDKPRALTAELKLDPVSRQHAWLRVAQNILLTMHYTEVLLEMAAKKWFPLSQEAGSAVIDTAAAAGSAVVECGSGHSRRAWLCLAAVELIKAYCRVSLLYANRGRMLTAPSQEEMVLDLMANIRAKQKREIRDRERYEYDQQLQKATKLQPADSSAAAAPSPSISSSPAASTAVQRCTPTSDDSLIPLPSDTLPPNSSFAPFASRPGHLPPLQVQNLLDLYVRHGRAQSVDAPLGRPHGRFVLQTLHPHESPAYEPPVEHVISEVLHILRPVVYTLARAAKADQPASWMPWLLSLSVDAASRALAPKIASLSRAEAEEVAARVRSYLFYMLRDPFFCRIVAGPLARFSALVARIPIIGGFFSGILSLIFSIQKFYFYTSAS